MNTYHFGIFVMFNNRPVYYYSLTHCVGVCSILINEESMCHGYIILELSALPQNGDIQDVTSLSRRALSFRLSGQV